MEEVSNFSPEMAVPMMVKMPEPMTAPMPSEVSEIGPSVFLRLVSGFSDSLMSLSIDLQQNTWGGSVRLLRAILLRGVYQGLRLKRHASLAPAVGHFSGGLWSCPGAVFASK